MSGMQVKLTRLLLQCRYIRAGLGRGRGHVRMAACAEEALREDGNRGWTEPLQHCHRRCHARGLCRICSMLASLARL